jgi:hypothetical protein
MFLCADTVVLSSNDINLSLTNCGPANFRRCKDFALVAVVHGKYCGLGGELYKEVQFSLILLALPPDLCL